MTAYTDDDVTVVMRVIVDEWGECVPWAEADTRAILSAVAPAIAARVLREAADDWPGYLPPETSSVGAWLRARAEQVNP